MLSYKNDFYLAFKDFILPSLDFIKNKRCRLLARFSYLCLYLLFVIPLGTLIESLGIIYIFVTNKFNTNFLKGRKDELIITYGVLAASIPVWLNVPYTALIFVLLSVAVLKIFKVPKP